MKYIKQYEHIENGPKVGDYVICKNDDMFEFNLEEHIGQVVQIDDINLDSIPYKIDYEDLEDYWWFRYEDLIVWSPNKKDCELYLYTNKYNL